MTKKRRVFHELATTLKGQICTHQLSPGSMLPSESELCGMYSISRASVRKALDMLCQEGHIYRQAGVGSFVSEAGGEKTEKNILYIGITDVGSNPYTSEIIAGARSACSQNNAQLVLTDTNEFIENRGKNVDGFLILSRNEQFDLDEINAISASGVPIAFFNRFCDRSNISYFSIDYELESKRAVEFLYRFGARDIGLIDCPKISPYASRTRSSGYRLGVEEVGGKCMELVIPASVSAVEIIRQFLEREKPEGLFVTMESTMDYVLLGCMYAGLKPGQDINIFCFGKPIVNSSDIDRNVIYADMQPREMAEQAVKHIIARRLNPYEEPVARKLFGVNFIVSSNNFQ